MRIGVYNSGSGIVLYRVLEPWDETSTWRKLDRGPDRIAKKPDARVGKSRHTKIVPLGPLDLDVTVRLRASVEEGKPNYGWALKAPSPGGTDSVGIRSSEYKEQTKRPMLTVVFVTPK